MIRRIIAIALVVLGLAGIAGAVGSATVWKPDEVVTLDLPADPDVPYVITEPGALTAVDDSVEVTVVAADPADPVMLAMGRTDDVTAWVGDSPHWVITGLSDWEHLSYTVAEPADDPTEEPTGESSDAPDEDAPDEGAADANPAGSDLWIDQVDGEGEIHYTWSKVPGRWSMLVAGDGGGAAPQVEFTWERDVPTPLLVPGIIGGAILLLIGIALLSADLLARREAKRGGGADTYEPELTEQLRAVDPDRPLTRRELREAERARGRRGAAAQRADTTEVLPVVAADDAAANAAELAAWAGGGEPERRGEPTPSDPMPTAADPAAQPHPADLQIPPFLLPVADRRVEEPPAAPADPGRTETIPAVAAVPPAPGEPEPGEPEPGEPEPGEPEPGDPADAENPRAGRTPRRRWWRRGRAAAPNTSEEPTDQAGDAPSPPPTETTEQAEPSPQVSGASWRATWGMGTGAAMPTVTDDADEEEQR